MCVHILTPRYECNHYMLQTDNKRLHKYKNIISNKNKNTMNYKRLLWTTKSPKVQNLNTSITAEAIGTKLKSLLTKKNPEPNGFMSEFYKYL